MAKKAKSVKKDKPCTDCDHDKDPVIILPEKEELAKVKFKTDSDSPIYFVVDQDENRYLVVIDEKIDIWKKASKINRKQYEYEEWVPKEEMEPVSESISSELPVYSIYGFDTMEKAKLFHMLVLKEVGGNNFTIQQLGPLSVYEINYQYNFRDADVMMKMDGLYDEFLQDDDFKYYKGAAREYKNQFELNKAIEELLNSRYDQFISFGRIQKPSGSFIPASTETIPINGQEVLLPESYPLGKALTSEEKLFVSRYSGYGGLEKFSGETKFSPEQLLSEFYTPDEVVKKMWALAYQHGYRKGPVLEPSVGTGRFLKLRPQDEPAVGFEINIYSAAVAKILNPTARIYLKFFEQTFIKNNNTVRSNVQADKYALIIGNPPYGDFSGKLAGMGEKKYTGATNFVEYFITRGLDLLIPGGLLVYIIGAQLQNGGRLFLSTGKTPAKEAIEAKAELLDAYRLPMGIFDTTSVTTEILVFKKR